MIDQIQCYKCHISSRYDHMIEKKSIKCKYQISVDEFHWYYFQYITVNETEKCIKVMLYMRRKLRRRITCNYVLLLS